MIRSTLSFLILAILFLISTFLPAQTTQVADKTEPLDSAMFDFWVGDWDLTWKNSDGTVSKGTNKILWIMDGKVLQENFEATGAGPFFGYKGMSVSVFNRQSKTWGQTWVDNQGGYLPFEGARDGEKRIFHRTFTGPKGKEVFQRMVFYNITKDSFDWDWERSTDGGENWKLAWRIHYKRKG